MPLSPATESLPNQKPCMQHHKWNIFTVPISSCSLFLLLLSRPTECHHLHWFHCHSQHCLSPAILSSTQHHQDILASGLSNSHKLWFGWGFFKIWIICDKCVFMFAIIDLLNIISKLFHKTEVDMHVSLLKPAQREDYKIYCLCCWHFSLLLLLFKLSNERLCCAHILKL